MLVSKSASPFGGREGAHPKGSTALGEGGYFNHHPFSKMLTTSLAIVSLTFVALTPVMTRYRGFFSGKVSAFGFSAQITVDGRRKDDPTDSDS